MKRLLLVALFASSAFGATQVTITGNLNIALNGAPAVGSIAISWPTFTEPDMTVVAAGSQTVYVAANGAYSFTLYPCDTATPTGIYYSATYQVRNGSRVTAKWIVPTPTSQASQTLTIANIQVPQPNLTPSFTALIGQIGCPTCNIGDIPTWIGPGYAPLPYQSIASGTFTAVSSLTVTASQHQQGCNLIVDFFDTSGNRLIMPYDVDAGCNVNAVFPSAISGTWVINGGPSIGYSNPRFSFANVSSVTVTQAQHHFASANLDVATYDTSGNFMLVPYSVTPGTFAVNVTLPSSTTGSIVIAGK